LKPLPITGLVALLFAAALAVAAVSVFRRWRAGAARPRRAAARVDLILLLWTGLPLLFYLRHNQYLQNYYLLYVLPAPLLLMARLSDRAYAWLAARWPATARPGMGWLAALTFCRCRHRRAATADGLMAQNRLASGRWAVNGWWMCRGRWSDEPRPLAERPGCGWW
jgi:hypothetical protein